MEVDRRADRPLYVQLADVLRSHIHTGQLAPGDRLPSENELIGTHDVSRGTVREAIGQLRAEGLIVVEHGRGAYVRPAAPPTYQRHLGSNPHLPLAEAFTAEATVQGCQPSIRQIGPSMLDGLTPPAGTTGQGVLCFADGVPVQAAVCWSTPAGDTVGGEQVRTRMPTRGERRLLQLDDGIPVLEVLRTSVTGRQVERSIAVLPADRTELTAGPDTKHDQG